jgi:hypothetical protein
VAGDGREEWRKWAKEKREQLEKHRSRIDTERKEEEKEEEEKKIAQ